MEKIEREIRKIQLCADLSDGKNCKPLSFKQEFRLIRYEMDCSRKLNAILDHILSGDEEEICIPVEIKLKAMELAKKGRVLRKILTNNSITGYHGNFNN